MVYIMTNRIVQMQGVLNFRDMGGYITNSGKQVKRNLFYRSAALSKMTAEDKVTMQKLGIKTIFDYRDDNEAKNHPTPLLTGITNIRVPAKGSATFKMPSAKSKEEITGEFFRHIDIEVFKRFYAHMPFQNKAFQQLFAILKQDSNLGLLHHCAAGKDRTGVGGALILLALDVPKETIIEDYLLTNELLTPMIKRYEEMLIGHLTEDEMKSFYDIMGANELYLQAMFNEIDTRYEKLTDFYSEELHLVDTELKELRQKYTV